MTRMIVTYFSATGTTEMAAEALAKAAHAELYRIEPAERYTRRDLDWNDASSRTSAERNDESARPSLAGKAPDLSAYDAVLVGFPIWWAVEPRIVDSFLDSVNLTGTTVIPFATSGGSGISRATERIRELHPEVRVLDGRVLNGSPSGRRLAEWVDGLGV